MSNTSETTEPFPKLDLTEPIDNHSATGSECASEPVIDPSLLPPPFPVPADAGSRTAPGSGERCDIGSPEWQAHMTDLTHALEGAMEPLIEGEVQNGTHVMSEGALTAHVLPQTRDLSRHRAQPLHTAVSTEMATAAAKTLQAWIYHTEDQLKLVGEIKRSLAGLGQEVIDLPAPSVEGDDADSGTGVPTAPYCYWSWPTGVKKRVRRGTSDAVDYDY